MWMLLRSSRGLIISQWGDRVYSSRLHINAFRRNSQRVVCFHVEEN